MAFIIDSLLNPFGVYRTDTPIGYPLTKNVNVVDPKSLFTNAPLVLNSSARQFVRPGMSVYGPGFGVSGLAFGSNFYEYDDVNSDPELRNNVVRYFRDKVLSFMANSYSDLLNHIAMKGSQYDVVKTDSSRENKDSLDVRNKKIEYIRAHVLSKRLIARLLERFTESTKMKWWNLRDNTEIVTDYLHAKLKKVLNDMANN